jgi:hypothetical protein
MKSENVRALVIFAVLVVLGAGIYWISGMGARARIKQVQSSVIAEIDSERSIGEVLATHPLNLSLEWVADWSGDTQLVCAKMAVATLGELPQPMLAELARLVHMTPEWASLVGERDAGLSFVFRLTKGSPSAVTVESVRLSRGWVVYRPEKVEAYESSLEDSIAHSGNKSEAARYRLEHDDNNAYFNVGVMNPTLAGAGLSIAGSEWVAAFAKVSAP